ncbi:395b0c28-2a3d-4e53-8da1-cef86f5f1825-CDS [Sclerotinia trifoliorum]|uniref:395b0c28-2a3d-4e53-8da1-cef86f5f1825-CDS n=1 Tax=Sclerotinia trifoliorum TaxID=28548 RepID=A0A8H2ZP86_9HELO|nr:395b0c28-2a3d-4e53-8da1-cef86f5f1825-CDS [Sclerotinia trifoliorum]
MSRVIGKEIVGIIQDGKSWMLRPIFGVIMMKEYTDLLRLMKMIQIMLMDLNGIAAINQEMTRVARIPGMK